MGPATSPRPDLILPGRCAERLSRVAEGHRAATCLDGCEHSARLARSGHVRRVPARSDRQRRRYRGELAIGRASRATNLYSADLRVDTTMQSCASAAKLRGGGPILNRGAKAIVQRRVAATSVRHLQPSFNATPGCSNSMARLRRRAKLQTRRRLARGREPPQHDEQLASERNDHRLACATAAI
jgi:hypothetical protein